MKRLWLLTAILIVILPTAINGQTTVDPSRSIVLIDNGSASTTHCNDNIGSWAETWSVDGATLVQCGAAGPAPPSWAPSDLDGLVLWLDATTGVQTDVDGVYSWEDQSGSGNNADQATGSKKPNVSSSWQNSLNGIVGDGIDDTLDTGSDVALSVGNWSAYFVVSAGESNYYMGSTGLADFLLRDDNGNGTIGGRVHGTNLEKPTNGWTTADPIILEFHHDDGTNQIRYIVDGSDLGLFALNATEGLSLRYLFSYAVTPGFAVGLGEVILYNQIVTGDDRTSARTYLSDKWSTY